MDWETNYGNEFRDELVGEVLMEEDGWATECVARVAERLQARMPGQRFEVLVPCLSAHTAFTTIGRYIYISRRLLERCANDDMVAMIIAHEIAHHELGHLTLRWPALPRVSALVMALSNARCRPEDELDADRRAIELCLAAGYAPAKCLELFRLLEHISLDHGDTVGVWGAGAQRRGSTERQHPPVCEREEAVRSRARELLVRRSTGDGVFRHAEVRELCHACPGSVQASCDHCQTPLCGEHSHDVDAPCASCGTTPRALCASCHEADQCFGCGASLHCRYCESLAKVSCRSCRWTFCAEHESLVENTCASCRFNRLHAAQERREQSSMLGIALAIVVALALLMAMAVLS